MYLVATVRTHGIGVGVAESVGLLANIMIHENPLHPQGRTSWLHRVKQISPGIRPKSKQTVLVHVSRNLSRLAMVFWALDWPSARPTRGRNGHSIPEARHTRHGRSQNITLQYSYIEGSTH